MPRILGYTVAVVLTAAVLTASLHAQAKKSDSMVKASAKATKPTADGKQTVTLTLEIENGWHAYANPLPQDFPGEMTKVTVESKVKPKQVKVHYPEGKLQKDKMFGVYHVYEGTESIKIDVERAPGDNSPLTLRVEVQTCNDRTCLPKGTLQVNVAQP